MRNFREHTGLPMWQAVKMASLNPAKSIGADDKKGDLAPGKDADILITDPAFNVRDVFVRGEELGGGNREKGKGKRGNGCRVL